MNICIINWSHRNNGSYKAANFIEARLADKWIQVSRINLADENIPFRDESRWDDSSETSKLLQPIRDILISAEWFVIISPEWAGMAAPGLKNLFLLASGQHEFAHKAALLVWVSASVGWVYPTVELRMGSAKNTKITYMPDSVIIRDIENVLDTHEMTEDQDDSRIKSRVDRSLDMLLEYTQALSIMRKNTKIDLMKHEYGM